ncbi:MAG: LacI family DNA-binding transcriptional regulator [Massiliimalia sp.]|jgi:LacI family transcriptional regulator
MKKITQQDIADALGFSRITVSKALNGTGNITDKTKRIVLSKAIELGYPKISRENREFLQESPASPILSAHKSIGLVTYLNCSSDSYWAPIIGGIGSILTQKGYDLKLCFVSISNDSTCSYPSNLNQGSLDGMILLGRFTRSHMKQLQKIGVPMISIDTTYHYERDGLLADAVLTQNFEPVLNMTSRLISQGHRKIGYAGRIDGCLSFRERWEGFRAAMKRHSIPVDQNFCAICKSKPVFAADDILPLLDRMDHFPTAFVCANDSTAIMVMQYLQEKGIHIPEDTAVCGFDNISESEIAGLTTVHIPKMELGMRAAEQLLWRIEHPDRPFELVRLTAQPVFRKSSDITLV